MTVIIYRPIEEKIIDSEGKICAKELIPKEVHISVERLADEISSLSTIADIIEIKENKRQGLCLSEIEINLVITASGKLAIMGSGIEAGAQAAIKIKYSKEKKEKNIKK